MNGGKDGIVDEVGHGKAVASVYDAMTDGINPVGGNGFGNALQGSVIGFRGAQALHFTLDQGERGSGVNQLVFDARGAAVDYQNVHSTVSPVDSLSL